MFTHNMSNKTQTEFAFRKCGPLAPNVFNPFAPLIKKPKELVTSGLRHKIDTHAVINILKSKFGSIIDCPLMLIPKIDTLNLTERQKAHYFKALYQSLPKIDRVDEEGQTELTYDHMYNKYYKDTNLDLVKPPDFRNFIYSCKDNKTPLKKLYEKEYFKFSRFDSI